MEKTKRRFWKKLAALLRAGVPLREAAESLQDDFEGTAVGDALEEVLDGLDDGKGLVECLGEHPDVFDPELVEALRDARPSGGGDSSTRRRSGVRRHHLAIEGEDRLCRAVDVEAAGEGLRGPGAELGDRNLGADDPGWDRDDPVAEQHQGRRDDLPRWDRGRAQRPRLRVRSLPGRGRNRRRAPRTRL